MVSTSHREAWPDLPYNAWADTCSTLHLWTQIVGKIRLAFTPWLNHSWHVPFYVTARGLTTSPIPCGDRAFEMDFDFRDHLLDISVSDGARKQIPLAPRPVAEFYALVMAALAELGIRVEIDELPSEIAGAVRFSQDRIHHSYDADYAARFWRVLLNVDRILKQFRTGFIGKSSPVHFFWGSFDLAVTRFSGRPAPPHPGGVPHLPDTVTREAYSQEVSSLGFWPGNEMMPEPIFYSYAYPEPKGFAGAKVQPGAAIYSSQLKEFVLPYDAIRQAAAPDQALLDFARGTYDAASTLGNWDRTALAEVKPDLHSRRQRS
jgi:Family of unknown function (DUF5996)